MPSAEWREALWSWAVHPGSTQQPRGAVGFSSPCFTGEETEALGTTC